jgi:hypothetical protein
MPYALVLPCLLAGALPVWYTSNRVHAHTRLRPLDYCTNETGAWACAWPANGNPSQAFASMGAPAFVRHTKSTGEAGLWWPSTSDPFESWHPFVQATNRSLPEEFIAEARAAGIKVIFYHYMKTEKYYSTHRPKWAAQWPNGSQIAWQRGVGLSPCSNDWQATYIRQVEQLVKFGCDAFYFDEYPTSWGGDWSPACRARFRASYGEEMPTELGADTCEGHGPSAVCQPVATDRRVHDMMTKVTEEYFANLTSAVARAAASSSSPRVVSLVSTFHVPSPFNGWSPSTPLSGTFETTRLLASPTGTTADKMELDMGAKGELPEGAGDPLDKQSLDSFGYVYMRDASQQASDGSLAPPHVWIAKLKRPAVSVCASAAVVAHGGIANPDHNERQLPDHTLFNETYTLAAKLSAAWSPTLRPVRWASILFSESARNAFLPSRPSGAWQHLLFPTLGAFGALLRAARPARVLVDWHLLGSPAARTVAEHPVLIAPLDAALPAPIVTALHAYKDAGGQLVRVSAADGWNASSTRGAAGDWLLDTIHSVARAPPTVQLAPPPTTPAAAGVQLHSYQTTDGGAMLAFVLNNFSACAGGSAAPMPAPVTGLRLELSVAPRSAVEVASGRTLDVQQLGPGKWAVALHTVAVVAAVALQL